MPRVTTIIGHGRLFTKGRALWQGKRVTVWRGTVQGVRITFHECPIYYPGQLPRYYWIGEARHLGKTLAVGMRQTTRHTDFRLHLSQADQIIRLILACVDKLDREGL